MNGAVVHVPLEATTMKAAAVADATKATATLLAAASKRLRDLANTLESDGIASATQVGSQLQLIAQQLLQTASAAAPAQSSPETDDLAARLEAEVQATGVTPGAPDAPADEDVAVLERRYAAAAVDGAAPEVSPTLQQQAPQTKKQRRGEQRGWKQGEGRA